MSFRTWGLTFDWPPGWPPTWPLFWRVPKHVPAEISSYELALKAADAKLRETYEKLARAEAANRNGAQ